MRIALDLDGVIAEFVYPATKIAVELGLTDYEYSTSEQEYWDFGFDVIPVFNYIKNSMNWWMGLYPIISTNEINLLNIAIEENDVYFITARPRTKGLSAEAQTRNWLSSIGVSVDNASVIATQAGKKGILCKALDIDIALEDRVDGVYEIMENGVQCFTRRWKYNDGDPLMQYVDSLEEFLLLPETNR